MPDYLDDGGYDPGRTAGDAVKEKYDAALGKAKGGIGHGIGQVAASGFGKGVILTALVMVAATAALAAFAGPAGLLTVGGAAVPTVEAGLAEGVGMGLSFLTSGFGLMTMALGGMAGAFMDARKHQSKIDAREAEILAKQYEISRQQQRGLAPEQAPMTQNLTRTQVATTTNYHPADMRDPNQPCFCDVEMKRREVTQQQVKTV